MSAVKSTLDIHASLNEKKLRRKSKYPWFDPDVHRIKHQRRIAKRHWIWTKIDFDRKHHSLVNTCYKKHIFKSKRKYIVEQITANRTNSSNLFKSMNGLIKGRKENPLPTAGSNKELANKFADFFINKIDKIQAEFNDNSIYTPPKSQCVSFKRFRPASIEELLLTIKSMKPTTCQMDLYNTKFLLKFTDTILDTLSKIVNLSITQGISIPEWKLAIVQPLIKSTKLDPSLQNYRPIINLTFISKLIEKKIILQQLDTHFQDNNLLPEYQSAYQKHHSKETAILNIHDNIIAMV